MKNTIVHDEGAASLEDAISQGKTLRLDDQDRSGCACPALRGGGTIRSLAAQAGAAAGAHGVFAVSGTTPARGPHRACGLRSVRLWFWSLSRVERSGGALLCDRATQTR